MIHPSLYIIRPLLQSDHIHKIQRDITITTIRTKLMKGSLPPSTLLITIGQLIQVQELIVDLDVNMKTIMIIIPNIRGCVSDLYKRLFF